VGWFLQADPVVPALNPFNFDEWLIPQMVSPML